MVSSETQQFDDVVGLVNPDKQEVVFYMAFYASIVEAVKLMGLVFRRYRACFLKESSDGFQGDELGGLVDISFQVFLKLCGLFQLLHRCIGLIRRV